MRFSSLSYDLLKKHFQQKQTHTWQTTFPRLTDGWHHLLPSQKAHSTFMPLPLYTWKQNPNFILLWRWRERYSGRIPSIDSEPLWMSKQSISNKRGTKYRSSPLAIPKRQPVITKHSTAYFLLKTQTRKAGSISFEMEKYQTGIKDASRHSNAKSLNSPCSIIISRVLYIKINITPWKLCHSTGVLGHHQHLNSS